MVRSTAPACLHNPLGSNNYTRGAGDRNSRAFDQVAGVASYVCLDVSCQSCASTGCENGDGLDFNTKFDTEFRLFQSPRVIFLCDHISPCPQLNVRDRSNMVLRMHPQDIRKKPKFEGLENYSQNYGVPTPPKISFLEVRWGGKEEVCTTTEQWGHANSSVHDMYIELFYEGTVYKRLGPDYEVMTVWISSSNDFAKLNAAHLFSQLRGKYKVGEK